VGPQQTPKQLDMVIRKGFQQLDMVTKKSAEYGHQLKAVDSTR